MEKRVIYFALVLCTSLGSVSAYVNDYDQPFEFNCPSSQIISFISSVFSNVNEDRAWEFHCRTAGNTKKCFLSGYVNLVQEMLVYRCPEKSVLTGVESYHDNDFQDRLFSFQCCTIDNRTPKNCYMTGYVNDLEKKLTLFVPEGRAIKSVYSFFHHDKEDRVWKYELCEI